MAQLARAAGALPLVGAIAAATALAGAAVFTVAQSGCDGGHYVQRAGQLQLVDSCLDPDDLPAAPAQNAGKAHQAGLAHEQNSDQVRP